MKHILTRGENELLKRVFLAQQEKPNQGDFVKLVESDLKRFDLKFEEIESMSKEQVKKELKKRASNAAFIELFQNLQRSTKVKGIKYNKLKLQRFLKSTISNTERTTITALRSKCVKGIKGNFPSMHKVCRHCPLKCNPEAPHMDTQEHVLVCSALGGSTADYNFIHGEDAEQRFIGTEYSKLMQKRAQLLEGEDLSSDSCCLPGADPDQSTTLQGGAAARLHNI